VEGVPDPRSEPPAKAASPPTWSCPRCRHEQAVTAARCVRCFAPGPCAEIPEHGATGALFWLFGVLLSTNVVLSWVLADLPDETPWDEPTVRRTALALTVAMAVDTVLVAIAYAVLRRRIVAPPGPPNAARAAWLLAPLVLTALLAVNVAYHWSLLTLAGVAPETDALMASGHHTAWLLVLACVQPAIVEEIFFRRLAFDFFLQHTGVGAAAFASSAMFAAAHTGALISFPVLLLIGGALAWMRWRTGSLLLPVLVHFLHNLAISIHDLATA
jgi:uncharacterized protein